VSLEDEFTRDTRAMERIADALEAWVKIQQDRYEKEFPTPKRKRDAELIRSDDSTAKRAEQFSDKPSAGWLEESPKEAEPSRFAKRFDEASNKAPAAKRSGTTEVPEGDGDKSKPS
jgi:hypothetical protein